MVTKLLRSKYFFLFTLFTGVFSSCSIFDTKEQIPSYIHIDKITFVPGADTSYIGEGTTSTKITDAWVFIDEQAVGAYELPATFPVQYSGVHTVRVLAGVKQNGISATRIKYPFYNSNTRTITLNQKETTTISSPTVSYFSGITFDMIEDFQYSGFQLTDTLADARLRIVSGAQAWGGGLSAYTQLAGDTIALFAKSSNTYLMQNDGHSKFLELNYKCNHPVVVGLTLGGNGTEPIVGLNASPNWNKVYINITDQIHFSGQYGFYFAMQKLLTDQVVPELYLDNIKLIHN